MSPATPKRSLQTSAGMGAIMWAAAPWLPVGSPPALGSLEHVFVFFPLVAAPIALGLLSALLEADSISTSLLRVARRAQPVAAAMVLTSFFFAKGLIAGALTVGWLAMALLLGANGVTVVKRGTGKNLSNVSLLAAHVFLPIGAVWLLLSRLGVGPRTFSALTVFLAAVHFHFTGFTLQILIASTGRKLRRATRLSAVHRCVAVGAVVGIPMIAAGNALPSPALKLAGVSSVVLAAIGLAVTSATVAFESRSPIARAFLFVSAASIAVAMVVAGIYGVGEVLGTGVIEISTMARVHGLLNAVGFTLCGLIGHLQPRPVADGGRRLTPLSAPASSAAL